MNQPTLKRIFLRKLLPWLVVAAVVAFAIYRAKSSPMPVVAHTVATGEVRGEVMGTGTLEAYGAGRRDQAKAAQLA